MGIVFFEEKMVPEHEARIPWTDRGFQFGDGAFATVQIREGTPLFLRTHLDRLNQQCASFNLKMPEIKTSIIDELIHLNKANTGIGRLKIIVTGGEGGENYLPEREGRVLIFLKPFTPLPFKPLKLGLFSTPYSSCHAGYKSLAHLNRFYVMDEALRKGWDDSVTTTERGILLEASFGNLFWVVDKTLYTPDPSLPLYSGVTLKNTLSLATSLGFKIEYIQALLTELPIKATAFRVNTMQGVRPVAQIEHHLFSPNQTIETIFIEGYEGLIEKEIIRYKEESPLGIPS